MSIWSKVMPVLASFVAGVGVGILFEEVRIKKMAEKYVTESLNKAVKEETAVKNEEIATEINKKAPEKEAFEEVSKQYRPSEEEKVTVTTVKMAEEGKEGAAEEAVPFRSRTVSSSLGRIQTCSRQEFDAADDSCREEIVYYTGDDCFYDEDGNRVEEPDICFGADIVDYFGTTSDDPDIVHIYNKEEDVYYEIQRKLGCFDAK